MLVLSRKHNEVIVYDFSKATDEELLSLRDLPPLESTIVDIRADKVRVGSTAPIFVEVHRKEVYDAIRWEKLHPEEAMARKGGGEHAASQR